MTDQIKLLNTLAKKIKSENKDRGEVVSSLQSAKILTKNENFTGYYTHLNKIIITNK